MGRQIQYGGGRSGRLVNLRVYNLWSRSEKRQLKMKDYVCDGTVRTDAVRGRVTISSAVFVLRGQGVQFHQKYVESRPRTGLRHEGRPRISQLGLSGPRK